MPIYGLYLSTLVHEFSGIYVRKLSNNLEDCKIENLKEINLNLFSIQELIDVRNHIFNNKVIYERNISVIWFWGKIEKYLKVIDAAINCFELSLQLDPNYIDSIRELGFISAETGNLEEALKYFKKITLINQNDWEAWNDGGCILRTMGNIKESNEWMKWAFNINSNQIQLIANIALLEFELNNYDEANKYLDIAFSLDPDYPEAIHTKAMLLSAVGKYEESYEYDLKALKLKPDYPQARLGLALNALTMGNFEEGFAGYEHRWVGSDKSDTKRMITLMRPWWLGQKVYPSSTIVITPEQGFGDMIQFSRFIPMLLKYFSHVYWIIPAELYRLMANSFSNDKITITNNLDTLDSKKIDYELPIMSLPLAFGITLETLPSKSSYLEISNDLFKLWENKLRNIKGLKVGLAWTGNATLSKHELRSIQTDLLRIIDSKDISFFSLQKFVKDDMIEQPSLTNFYNFMHECNDFMDTAALISNLDLIISVDTVIVHLSASLGKPTWLLNRFGSEWRWLDNKDTSPWYPTIRIFNQSNFKDWDNVLKRVKKDLKEIITNNEIYD